MTKPTDIATLEQIAEKAVEIAKARPDYVFTEECEYYLGRQFDDDGEMLNDYSDLKPGCLFGNVFAELGLGPDVIPEDTTIDWLLEELGYDVLDIEKDEWHPLAAAMKSTQELQDGRKEWGEAIVPLEKALLDAKLA